MQTNNAVYQRGLLAKELQTLFKPESQYSYSAHNYRSSPWLQIYDARHMKVDTSQYQRNSNYFSNLYKSMRGADISHQDILAIWGNPYIGVVTKWSELSQQRKQRLVQEYPGIDDTAEKIRHEREEFKHSLERMLDSPMDRFIDQMVIPMTTFALSNTPYGRAYAVAKTVVVPRLGQIATAIGASELYRRYISFSKKHNNDGLKKGTETNAPRLQATRGDADKYLQGLKYKGVLGKKGTTKDGHEYYQFVKKCEYKGMKFKNGEYISRDTQHHDWEYFRNPKTHNGAIDPIRGDIYKDPVPGRSLKLP